MGFLSMKEVRKLRGIDEEEWNNRRSSFNNNSNPFDINNIQPANTNTINSSVDYSNVNPDTLRPMQRVRYLRYQAELDRQQKAESDRIAREQEAAVKKQQDMLTGKGTYTDPDTGVTWTADYDTKKWAGSNGEKIGFKSRIELGDALASEKANEKVGSVNRAIDNYVKEHVKNTPDMTNDILKMLKEPVKGENWTDEAGRDVGNTLSNFFTKDSKSYDRLGAKGIEDPFKTIMTYEDSKGNIVSAEIVDVVGRGTDKNNRGIYYYRDSNGDMHEIEMKDLKREPSKEAIKALQDSLSEQYARSSIDGETLNEAYSGFWGKLGKAFDVMRDTGAQTLTGGSSTPAIQTLETTKGLGTGNVVSDVATNVVPSIFGLIGGYGGQARLAGTTLGQVRGSAADVTQNIRNPILRTAFRGALEDAAFSIPQYAWDSKSMTEFNQNVLVEALGGAGGELAFAGLGKGLKSAKKYLTYADLKGKLNDVSSMIIDRMKKDYDSVKNVATDGIQQEESLIRGSIKLNDVTTPSSIEPSSQKIVSLEGRKNKVSASEYIENARISLEDDLLPINKLSKNLGNEGKALKYKSYNSKNANGTAGYILSGKMVNKAGEEIGESYADLLSKIPDGSRTDFTEYLSMRDNLDGIKLDKPRYLDYNAEKTNIRISELEAAHPEFKQIAEDFYKWQDMLGEEWLVNTGMLSKEQYNIIKAQRPNWVPSYRDFSDMEKGLSGAPKAGKGFVNKNSGVKAAGKSGRNIIDPLESMRDIVVRRVKAAKFNEVGQEIYNITKNDPESVAKYFELIDNADNAVKTNVDEVFKNGNLEDIADAIVDDMEAVTAKEIGSTNKKLDNVVSVLIDGERKYIRVKDKNMLIALKGIAGIGSVEPNVFKKAVFQILQSAVSKFKGVVTGKNPLFAVKNLFRDIPTAYINGSEKNLFKFFGDYIDAYKEIFDNGTYFKRYKALGGTQSQFLSSTIDELKHSGNELKGFKKVFNKVEEINTAVEAAPRLAEFKRIAKLNGDTAEAFEKALFSANELTVNFARGGKDAKWLDKNFTPYLNASVQGLSKLIRQVKNNPKATIGKGVSIVTVPSAALYLINMNNPDYQQLDQRTKDNNYLIPVGDGKFIKIPKSREWGVTLGVTFERLLNFVQTGSLDSFDGLATTAVTNLAPVNPVESNIFSPITYNLVANKDFAGRPIVPGNLQGLSPKYQYDDSTSIISKSIGGALNISPKQIDYLIKSYSGIIGQLGLPLAGGSSSKNPVEAAFIADKSYSNKASTEFYNNKNKYTTKYNDMKFKGENDPKTKAIKAYYDRAASQISNFNKARKDLEKRGEGSDKIKEYREQMNLIAESANNFKKSIESNGNIFTDIYGISSNADEANKVFLQSESPADFIKVMPASFEIPKDGDKIKYNLTPLEYKDLESIFKFKLNDLMEGDITEKSLKNKVEHAYDYAVKTMRKKLGA